MLIFLSHVTEVLLLATYSAFIAYISGPTTLELVSRSRGGRINKFDKGISTFAHLDFK